VPFSACLESYPLMTISSFPISSVSITFIIRKHNSNCPCFHIFMSFSIWLYDTTFMLLMKSELDQGHTPYKNIKYTNLKFSYCSFSLCFLQTLPGTDFSFISFKPASKWKFVDKYINTTVEFSHFCLFNEKDGIYYLTYLELEVSNPEAWASVLLFLNSLPCKELSLDA
jgi:hypothetical protein